LAASAFTDELVEDYGRLKYEGRWEGPLTDAEHKARGLVTVLRDEDIPSEKEPRGPEDGITAYYRKQRRDRLFAEARDDIQFFCSHHNKGNELLLSVSDRIRYNRIRDILEQIAPPKAPTVALESVLDSELSPTAQTAGAETKCLRWLKEQMEASPKIRPMARAKYLQTAMQKSPKLSKRAFERAWRRAIEQTGSEWGKSGRPKKSPHQNPRTK
jgi:hypothetical protein